jgi:hypothetical protein
LNQQQQAAAQKAGDQQALTALQQKAAEFTEEHDKIKSALGALVGDKQKADYAKQHGDIDKTLAEQETAVATPKSIDEVAAIAKAKPTALYNDEQRARQADIVQRANGALKGMQGEKDREAAAKKAESDFSNTSVTSGLQGDAYLNTLDQPHRDILTSIAEGRNPKMNVQNRKGELTPLGLAVMQAYPDFNFQKAAKYGDTLKEYQSVKNGTAGGMLDAGGTALTHLARLMQINDQNPVDVHRSGSPSNKAYATLLNTVADELGTFYNEPKTNDVIKGKIETLGGLWNRNSAITEQARAMTEKFNSLQTSWDNASPRDSFRPPMPNVTDDAKTAMQKIVPEFVAKNPQFAPAQAWSASAWQKTNPNGDVNAAIQAAKAAGHKVTQ